MFRRVMPFAGTGWLVWPFAIGCAACAIVPNRLVFTGLGFLVGVFLTIGSGVTRKYDQMVARLFALFLQSLAIGFLITGRRTSIAENMLFLGQIGIAGVFPFCFSGREYTSGPGEILPYALCVLLSPAVKFSPILLLLSVVFHLIGAVNEQYVWKFIHRLFATTICLLISFAGVFHSHRWLFVLSFYQLLFLYLSIGSHIKADEHLTMAGIKGLAQRRPGAALELALGAFVLGGGPLSVFFPLLSSVSCLLLLLGHRTIVIGICVLLCVSTAIAVRWSIQLSLRSVVECRAAEVCVPWWLRWAMRLSWIGPWIIMLQKSYRYYTGF
ncbi:MAG: hypothetical protein LBD72_02020 [Puniceicoccales bacterium]|nr:hypothetical protein [Puniceicoccales bacterium]